MFRTNKSENPFSHVYSTIINAVSIFFVTIPVLVLMALMLKVGLFWAEVVGLMAGSIFPFLIFPVISWQTLLLISVVAAIMWGQYKFSIIDNIAEIIVNKWRDFAWNIGEKQPDLFKAFKSICNAIVVLSGGMVIFSAIVTVMDVSAHILSSDYFSNISNATGVSKWLLFPIFVSSIGMHLAAAPFTMNLDLDCITKP